MATETDLQKLTSLKARMASLPARPTFDKGRRQSNNAHMEARIASLETKVDRLSDASQRIEATVAEMSGILKATLPNLLEKVSATDSALTEIQLKLATSGARQEAFEKSVNDALPKLATTEALKQHPTKGWTLWLLGGLVALIAGSMAIGAGLKATWGAQSQAAAPAAEALPTPPKQ